MPPKVIRDPVHDHIFFDRQEDEIVLTLLGCREVQRLRRIRQLGVSHFTYPGAEHSRFSHSLGVCYLMRRALRHVRANHSDEVPLSEEHEMAVMAAALLHDIGHGPFSHVLEKEFGGKHEKRTLDVIRDKSTEVHEKLAKHEGLPELVAAIFEGQDDNVLWLRALVTSQLDVDRMDYLLRDSHFCGVGYGRYDLQYIFHTMRIRRVPPDNLLQPVWLEKACRVIEEYLFARYYMHWNVYYHKTTKGYEELLKAICERAANILADGGTVPGDTAVMKFVKGEELSNQEYLSIDDHVLMHHVELWQDADAILGELCRRFLNRGGLKPIIREADEEESSFALTEAINSVRATLQRAGLDPRYYFRESSLSATTYDYYHPEKETGERTAGNAILIEQPSGGVEEISSIKGMERLRVVTGKRERRRYFYVPEEHRDVAMSVLNST